MAKNNLTELDFEGILNDLKSFFSSKSEFSDYDFSGSNISILLEALAYNTQKQALIAHLQGTEAFLSSAQIRGNVVSHAKSLSYIPRSVKSAIAKVNIVVSNPIGDNPEILTLDKSTRFSSIINGTEYQFVVKDTQSSSISLDGKFYFNNVELIQGIRKRTLYRYDKRLTNPRFKIPEKNVDTITIDVSIRENDRATTGVSYAPYNRLSSIDGTTPVFFLQEGYDGHYEIYFGDNIIGLRPDNNNIIVIDYVYGKGPEANDATIFSITDDIEGNTDISVTTVEKASLGAKRENIERIRFTAPLVFSAQDRAVTESDYKGILLQNFDNIDSITVWGGETNDPPNFAQMNIAIKPSGTDFLTKGQKEEMTSFLKGKNVIPITPKFIDPEFTFIDLFCEFKFNPNKTSLSKFELESLVRTTILSYNDDVLEKFGGVFRASNLTSLIDSSNAGIISNILRVFMYKTITPSNTSSNYFELQFTNPIYTTNGTEFTIKSDPIVINGINHFIGDKVSNKDGERELFLYKTVNEKKQIVNSDIGRIYSSDGKVVIKNFIPDTTESLKITLLPDSDDLSPKRNQLLKIASEFISVKGEIDSIAVGGTGFGSIDYSSASRVRL